MISGEGEANESTYGLAFFVNPADIVDSGATFSDSKIILDGINGVISGGSVTSADNGRLIYARPNVPGDSGGAFVFRWQGSNYVLGTMSGQDSPPTRTFGTYFTENDWLAIHSHLKQSQTGNVTSREPTNFMAGSSSSDEVYGTYRADIIHGLEGDDTLWSGDDSIVWADDQLFGGDGNDLLIGSLGGDKLDGGSGYDTVYYVDASSGVKVDLSLAQGKSDLVTIVGFAGPDGGQDAVGDRIGRVEEVIGSYFSDDLRGGGFKTTLSGSGGDDELHGKDGDTLFGGSGQDSLYADEGAIKIIEIDENDTIYIAGQRFSGTFTWHPDGLGVYTGPSADIFHDKAKNTIGIFHHETGQGVEVTGFQNGDAGIFLSGPGLENGSFPISMTQLPFGEPSHMAIHFELNLIFY